MGDPAEHGGDDDRTRPAGLSPAPHSQPMLIVWGAQDELIPLSSGERMHELIPGSVLDVVDGCGHLAPSECCDRC